MSYSQEKPVFALSTCYADAILSAALLLKDVCANPKERRMPK